MKKIFITFLCSTFLININCGYVKKMSSSKGQANESAVMANLTTIKTAQNSFKMRKVLDLNSNGSGEYGFFKELAGEKTARTSSNNSTMTHLSSFLSKAWINADKDGVLKKNGYFYRLCIIYGDSYYPTPEEYMEGRDNDGELDETAENDYLVIAWPQYPGKSGNKIFYMFSNGDIKTVKDPSLLKDKKVLDPFDVIK